MINTEQQKWQNYIKQTPIKNITELQNGDIFYIDTDNSLTEKTESNHKFRPVILIDGSNFDKYNFAPKTSEYHKKIYDGNSDATYNSTLYFIPLTTTHDRPNDFDQKYDILIDQQNIDYSGQTFKNKPTYAKATKYYNLDFDTACEMEDKDFNNVHHIGHIKDIDTLYKQLVSSIRRYEKETHPEYFNQNKISIVSNWEKRPEPNPTVDYYKYNNPNGTFYKSPSKNNPDKGLEL